MRRVRFARTILLSHECPTNSAAEWRKIPRLQSRADYSRFMLRELANHIDTSHALCIQWDGFVLNSNAWLPAFLEYDYIGSVWPQFRDGRNVGNGGFSLRSKRLLEACRDLPLDGSTPEDMLIARIARDVLEERGIRFAPDTIARQFAYERTEPTGQEFGFHGAFNLVRYLSPDEAVDLFRSLEPGVLTRGEHLEILRWALRQRQGRLALAILARLRSSRAREPTGIMTVW